MPKRIFIVSHDGITEFTPLEFFFWCKGTEEENFNKDNIKGTRKAAEARHKLLKIRHEVVELTNTMNTQELRRLTLSLTKELDQ